MTGRHERSGPARATGSARVAAILMGISLCLAACADDRGSGANPGAVRGAGAEAGRGPDATGVGAGEPGARPTGLGGSGSDASALPPMQPDTGSPEAAVAVVRDYHAALAAGDFAAAYALWGDGGAASGRSLAQFRSEFEGLTGIEAEIGEPGRVEPAAGSRYIRVPVEVTATDTGGAPHCTRGALTLRRAVVPGASAEQRRWRIYAAELEPCDGTTDRLGGGPPGGRREDPAA